MLQIQDLSLTLGTRNILQGVNLSLDEGDIQLVIGPNGVGKSSLLKCILGLHHYSGHVALEGQPAMALSARERARKIAYVPQFLDLQFNLDVRSFLELSRFAHDPEPPAQRNAIIEEALRQTETFHLSQSFLDELSGGERQRVLIAAALAQKPRLLILDEPSTAMDPGHRRDLVQLLERLHRQEKLTMLVVTHDWNEYMHLNPSILALKEGSVAFQCKADTLKDHLEDLFGCGFQHIQSGSHWLSIPRYQ